MSEEKVLAGLEVETQLRIGKEHLLFLFTNQRILFSHLAKIGRESMALSGILGGLSGGLGRGPGDRSRMQRIAALSPEAILKLHKDNFAVSFDKVVSLSIEPESYSKALMVLVTADMKIEMLASLAAARGVASELRDVLGEKFSLRL